MRLISVIEKRLIDLPDMSPSNPSDLSDLSDPSDLSDAQKRAPTVVVTEGALWVFMVQTGSSLQGGDYQLDFLTPGMSPLEVISKCTPNQHKETLA